MQPTVLCVRKFFRFSQLQWKASKPKNKIWECSSRFIYPSVSDRFFFDRASGREPKSQTNFSQSLARSLGILAGVDALVMTTPTTKSKKLLLLFRLDCFCFAMLSTKPRWVRMYVLRSFHHPSSVGQLCFDFGFALACNFWLLHSLSLSPLFVRSLGASLGKFLSIKLESRIFAHARLCPIWSWDERNYDDGRPTCLCLGERDDACYSYYDLF